MGVYAEVFDVARDDDFTISIIMIDSINIDQLLIFEEIHLETNNLLAKLNFEATIREARRKIGRNQGMTFVPEEIPDAPFILLDRMPKLKDSIFRIGLNTVWLPLAAMYCFAGDPRLN